MTILFKQTTNGSAEWADYSFVIPKSPTNLTTSSILSNTLTLSFTSLNSKYTSYTVISTPSGAIGNSTTNSMNISGLAPGTSYTFNIIATNTISGVTAISATSAPIITPPVQVTNISASSIGTNTLTLNYSSTNGPATTYTVTSTPPGATVDSSGNNFINISRLIESTNYTFTITSTASGTSVTSAASTTYTTNPSAPTVTGVTITGQNTATVYYSSSNGPVATYSIATNPGGGIIDTSSNNQINVKGLTAGTSYQFAVIATSNGNSVSSVYSSNFTTQSGKVFTATGSYNNSTVGSYNLITFTGNGSFSCAAATSINVLLVGPGITGNTGGGSSSGASGGRGGNVGIGTLNISANTVYTVTIGTSSSSSNNMSIISGGGINERAYASAVTAGLGSLTYSFGGGGGAGGKGGTTSYNGGSGGSGVLWSINGKYYGGGGGGGGGTYTDSFYKVYYGNGGGGGKGGGGSGGKYYSTNRNDMLGKPGSDNTGGGGGGGGGGNGNTNLTGGTGGSGICIIAYTLP